MARHDNLYDIVQLPKGNIVVNEEAPPDGRPNVPQHGSYCTVIQTD